MSKIRMDKKGFSLMQHALYRVLVVVFLIFFIGGIVYFVGVIRASASQGVFDMEQRIVETRMLYSPYCFAHETDEGRGRPGIIDVQKVNDATVRDCINFDQAGEIGVRMHLFIRESDQDIREVLVSTPNWGNKVNSPDTVNTYPVLTSNNEPAVMTFTYKQ